MTSAPTTATKTAPTTAPERPAATADTGPGDGTGTTTTPKQAAGVLLNQVAGYIGHRTIAIGLRTGLLPTLADHPDGLEPRELAAICDLDELYVSVWCRSALAAGLCDRDGDALVLAPHMATLLLDRDAPGYVGAIFTLLGQEELFDRFEDVLDSGERLWWDDCSPEWIAGVASTGRPFYTRLVPDGLDRVPQLADRLADGGRIVDTACGGGVGLVRLAETYPACEVVGVDGDARAIETANERVLEAGVADRTWLEVSSLEELSLDQSATLVVNNISMHECRDIDEVTRRIHDTLEPGGWFVISDFPFPDSDEGLRTVPGRVMAGIQFFEAQIDDQLVPRHTYDDLLARHGFTELGNAELTPVHALTWGRRAA